LKNLSVNQCQTEQDGLDLLMMGNFSRHVASTPINHNSSRSHCIFTIILQSKDKEKDTYFTSKINLVDLAGSERTWKVGLHGKTF